jgi:hypothetical protein
MVITNLAEEFRQMLDRWFSLPEVYDDALDAEILRQKLDLLGRKPVYPPRNVPYFSPSSAESDPRELYMKMSGAKRDINASQPHQGRWRKIGTMTGDMIQRELLFIEKHYERLTGEAPPFTVERTPEGFPMWEGFAKKTHGIEHNGEKFAYFGAPDGILRHHSGLLVGLEWKSKQSTPAKTSAHSMTEAEHKHVEQTVVYSDMYGVDTYLIAYLNLAKKAWVMGADDYEKNPDLRVFQAYFTESNRRVLRDRFADLVRMKREGTPPPLDLSKFTFNNFKTACALSLSAEEFAEIQAQVRAMLKSRLPEWKKQQYYDAFEFIKDVREKGAA